MILDFTNEIDEALAAIGVTGLTSKQTMALAMVFAKVLDRGMGTERRRVLDIVARKAMNAAELRAEINRSVR
ncbi:hypothetical protein X747_15040 [Mesorhizobium sp. LNJC384A00]|uniref:hypothetical protein n=1 Tax=unclassified Mesorhizobium TaxID=325217 RepID=UPI0003CF5355|nr:hypothetical protein [Mesorhizobium sp. LNJC384A00]ESY42075.1 hypothetical protein X747_15040 [Mesorhizobium sp. LNJC384A00]